MRILVVDGDEPVASLIQKGLQAESHSVECASDGAQARAWIDGADYDLLILDMGLPKADGLEVLKHVRACKPSLPVLMLSSRHKAEECVRGLDLAADDYLPTPFTVAELSARVHALLHRLALPRQTRLRLADLEVELTDHTVCRSGKRIELTRREFALLAYLLQNAGCAVSRAMILNHVWNISFDTSTNIVDVYVNYLRSKMDKGFQPKLIHTVRGVGYQMSLATQDRKSNSPRSGPGGDQQDPLVDAAR